MEKKFQNFHFSFLERARPVRCGGKLPRIYTEHTEITEKNLGYNQEEDFLVMNCTV